VLPGVMRPLRILWNEVIGFLFLVIGVSSAFGLIRGFRELDKPYGMLKVVVIALFALLMLYYGVTSFLRARKIGRS
jgi:hypothetical protein